MGGEPLGTAPVSPHAQATGLRWFDGVFDTKFEEIARLLY